MVVIVLVIGVWLGWLVRSARNQREAVAAINDAGGLVFYDGKWLHGVHDFSAKTWAPCWLVDLVGFDYFGRVTFVNFDSFTRATDPRVAPVADRASLEQLPTRESCSPGPVLAHLKRLHTLTILRLNGRQVTDDELIHVSGLTNLTDLGMVSTRITGIGLGHLKPLARLSKLFIHDAQLTDDGLANLKNLTSLSSLSLVYTPISDAGLAHLKGLTKLTLLDLRDTQVTDAGVKDLEQALPSLKIRR